MTVADIFATNMASTTKLATMILPQLEGGTHGVKVAGMMFFDDHVYCLRAADPVGERLAKVAAEQGILLMVCDQCAVASQTARSTSAARAASPPRASCTASSPAASRSSTPPSAAPGPTRSSCSDHR